MEKSHHSRLIVADDHTLIAEACKKLLEPEFQVVGVVTNGKELLDAAAEVKPDLIILDIAMPIMNGLIAATELKRLRPSVKLVFLSMSASPELVAEAFRRGGSGYVVKQCSADELKVAVRRVLRGESYISPLITKETVEFLLRSGATYREKKQLTARQEEILQLIAEGRSMKEIAYMVSLKHGTIAFHKYRMMETLGITSSAGLLEYAIRKHLALS